jgi:hypothetical protein
MNITQYPMKNSNGIAPAAALLLSCLLAACGGGGNESGPPDRIELSPTSVRVGSSGNCVTGLGPEVFVYGGTPPYKLSNSVPQGMQLNKTSVADSGESFTITFINNVCLQSVPITLEDKMGRLATVSVSNGS